MSDVNLAPPPAPAPSQPQAPPPAAAPREVAVELNPVTPPAPISGDGPPRPEGEKPRFNSRREAIAEAFRKAEAKGRPGPAEARRGHNQPPEEMADEDKLNLKKRPGDQPSERPRGDRGRFARVEDAAGARPQEAPAPQQQQPGQPRVYVNPLPENAPYREPPKRMRDQAKAEWHTAPESVRGEVHRMHREFG
jgi:hypothetical protein